MINKTLELLDQRRSHRAYKKIPLTDEQIDALVYAGISSPSANNHQPWHFTVVKNQELLNEINQEACNNVMRLPEASRNARFVDPDFHIFYHAPAVIFISAINQPGKKLDCGIAVQSIAIAAQSLGLGSVILGLPNFAFQGDKKEAFEKALHFPNNYEFAIAIAVGHPDDEKDAPVRDYQKISFVD